MLATLQRKSNTLALPRVLMHLKGHGQTRGETCPDVSTHSVGQVLYPKKPILPKVESVLRDMATHSNKKVGDVKGCLLVHCLEATSFLCRQTHMQSSMCVPALPTPSMGRKQKLRALCSEIWKHCDTLWGDALRETRIQYMWADDKAGHILSTRDLDIRKCDPKYPSVFTTLSLPHTVSVLYGQSLQSRRSQHGEVKHGNLVQIMTTSFQKHHPQGNPRPLPLWPWFTIWW